nr:hypothetical protein [Tanacetum cinerariifolium]
DAPRGLLPPVVIREPESGKYQPLPEVQGKGKEKVTNEQVALDLHTLQTPKKKSPADQFIFQRHTSTPTESSGPDESSSLYAKLRLTDSEGKKRKLVTETSDKPFLARRSKSGLVTKRRKPTSSLRSVDESVDEDIPKKKPRFDDEDADVQRALEESLKSVYDAPRGLLPPVVIREPESGKYQPLLEVQGKGKKKVTDE